ncbi:MAG: ATP-dependent Clp protease adaptor protein ClpS [Ignavibacteria bacterium]|nr:MAG: ATP-dependent Clp protease adaptor protein ClpS [Ignavibacteria bacterium]KAF0161389.1 MAG: ATP-dependent Clp protease adaptor protein ClpS [Ignavibacteria bacterium]
MVEQNPQEINEIQNDEDVAVRQPFKVVLFNDDFHSFDEVIFQLIKAIKCSFEAARDFAFEAHVKGKAIVFNGALNECLKVSSVLEEIALHTQILS